MNRIIRTLILPGALLGALTACDNISEDDRYIAVDPVEAARVVLIEDFTGQNCINCPDAHEVIEQLQEQYPGSIVAVSIHAGDFGISKSRTDFATGYIGLMSDEGCAYNDSWGIDAWPAGVINRRGGVQEYDKWSTLVRDQLALAPTVNIELTARVENGSVVADVTLEPKADIDGSLQLWVLESGIVARQRSTAGTKQDYVHNNVFRAAINGIDGQEMKLRQGIHQTITSSIELRDNAEELWVPENLSVVAFVYNSDGVQQAAMAKVQPAD